MQQTDGRKGRKEKKKNYPDNQERSVLLIVKELSFEIKKKKDA